MRNMIKKGSAAFLLLVLCCICMTDMAYAKTSVSVRTDQVTGFIDKEIQRLVQQGMVKGITVALVKDQEIVLCKGYGYADEKKGISVDPENSTFMIGSVSKVFVPIAAMQLAERGLLDLDVSITRYLGADFLKLKYPVTMKQLLTHTAGFDFMLSGLETEDEKDRMSLKEFVRDCQPAQVNKPGEISNYSNYGIALAGYVIECISGQSFAEYAQDNIFEPLNMNHTTYMTEARGIASKAYNPSGEEKKDVVVNSYPAGSVTSTARDMAEFMNFLLGEEQQTVLSNASKREILAKNYTMEEELPGMGYVWMRHEANGHAFFTHDGGTANFTSEIAVFPEEKLGLFISCNQINGSKYSLADCIYGTAELLYGNELTEKASILDEEEGIKLNGYYAPANRIIRGSDRLLNVLYYGFTTKLTGNSCKDYRLNGMELKYLGSHRYEGKSGIFTFVQKNDRLYYTLNGSNNYYIRVPWYESSQWQILFLLPALLILASGFLIFGIRFLAGIITRKRKADTLVCIPPIAVFVMLGAMVLRFICHIDYMNEVFGGLNCTVGLAGVLAFFRIAAAMFLLLGLSGVASGIYLWFQRNSLILRWFYLFWCVAVFIFMSWLVRMNLLF